MSMPIDTRFTLGERLDDSQLTFFKRHGFIHFKGFAKPEEVAALRKDLDQVGKQWIAEGREKINGIPIKYGTDVDGSRMVQRYAFTSQFGKNFHNFVHDKRFDAIKELIGEDCRVGDREKDGVVVNHYVNTPGSRYARLGWHTDGLRDIFYGRRPGPMLNVGVYLDDSPRSKGGLRLVPGSHEQNLFRMIFAKPYFVYHRPDRNELCVEAKAGDLTIHDGRLWHRVARAESIGEASRRRIMYVPFLNGPYEPKDANSKTPFYHRLQWVTNSRLRTKK